MIIERQILEEVLLLKPQIFEDDRGYFFESFKQNQFKDLGLDVKFVQDTGANRFDSMAAKWYASLGNNNNNNAFAFSFQK